MKAETGLPAQSAEAATKVMSAAMALPPESLAAKALPAMLLAEATRRIAARGIRIVFRSDIAALSEVKRGGFPVIAPIDPSKHPMDGHDSFWIQGIDKDGDTVLTQAARFYDWTGTNLEEMAGEMWFGGGQRLAGRRWDVTTPAAKGVGGRVCYSGSSWYREDYRGIGLASITPRISRAYAKLLWNTDWTFSVVRPHTITSGAARAYGYTDLTTGIVWYDTDEYGNLDVSLLRMPAEELLSDIRSFLAKEDVIKSRGAPLARAA